jgi:uncharacterized membrane protein
MKLADIVLIFTTVLAGLMAGLFYAFSISVVSGLGELPDAEFIRAFQGINRAILNPVFLLCFLSILVLLPVCTFLHFSRPADMQFRLILAAALIYITGVFAVTAAGNMPLNNALDAFNVTTSSLSEIHQQRLAFEARWNMLNHIRTICSTMSMVLLIIACKKIT